MCVIHCSLLPLGALSKPCNDYLHPQLYNPRPHRNFSARMLPTLCRPIAGKERKRRKDGAQHSRSGFPPSPVLNQESEGCTKLYSSLVLTLATTVCCAMSCHGRYTEHAINMRGAQICRLQHGFGQHKVGRASSLSRRSDSRAPKAKEETTREGNKRWLCELELKERGERKWARPHAQKNRPLTTPSSTTIQARHFLHVFTGASLPGSTPILVPTFAFSPAPASRCGTASLKSSLLTRRLSLSATTG